MFDKINISTQGEISDFIKSFINFEGKLLTIVGGSATYIVLICLLELGVDLKLDDHCIVINANTIQFLEHATCQDAKCGMRNYLIISDHFPDDIYRELFIRTSDKVYTTSYNV